MNNISHRYTVREVSRILTFSLPIAMVTIVLFSMPRISVPLIVGYLMCLVVNISVSTLTKLRISRGLSTIAISVLIIAGMGYPLVKLVPVVKKEIRNVEYRIPVVKNYMSKEYISIMSKIKEKTGYDISSKYISQLIDHGQDATKQFFLSVPGILAGLLEWYFLIPIFFIFMLKDGRKLRKLILAIAPNSIFEQYYRFSYRFNRQLGDYIFAKFIEASIVGIMITLGLLIIDVRFALLLGIIAAITNIIPYLGPFMGLIPAVALGVVEYGLGAKLGLIVALYTVSNAIDIAIVFPILVSKIVNLHPLIVIISVILGSQYLGILGMVISIPLVSALKLLFQELHAEVYSPHTCRHLPDDDKHHRNGE